MSTEPTARTVEVSVTRATTCAAVSEALAWAWGNVASVSRPTIAIVPILGSERYEVSVSGRWVE